MPTEAKEAAKDAAAMKLHSLSSVLSRENHPTVRAENPTANKAIPASCVAKANGDASCAEARDNIAPIAQTKPARSGEGARAGSIVPCGERRALPNARIPRVAMKALAIAYASRPSKAVEEEAKNRFWK